LQDDNTAFNGQNIFLSLCNASDDKILKNILKNLLKLILFKRREEGLFRPSSKRFRLENLFDCHPEAFSGPHQKQVPRT